MTLQQTHPISTGPITDIPQLRNHLHQAAALELSTIPLYLYSAYSIETAGSSQWAPGMSAFRTIRSVVIEEMLHLCLVRNLLVAIGGGEQIRFYDEAIIPTYPAPMLHRIPELILQLEPCSPQVMQDVFMPLELPAMADAPPEPDRYGTIGQFYAAITAGFERLSGPELWQDPRPDLQYDEAYWNQDGGGKPLVVTDLPSALAAIATIVEQGEGSSPGDDEVPLAPAQPQAGLDELSHYAKFSRIASGIDPIGVVRPVAVNPRRADYAGSLGQLAELFDAAYCYVLCMIDAIYASTTTSRKPGHRSERYALERTFIAAMGGLLFPLGDLLAQQRLSSGPGNAGPGFGYYHFADDRSKKDQLIGLCDRVLGSYPSLGGDDGVRQLIGRLPAV